MIWFVMALKTVFSILIISILQRVGTRLHILHRLFITLSSDGLLVGCGEDAYLITQLQLPIGKGAVLSGSDMMNGWADILVKGAFFAETVNE